jgi:hypothetical protein
MSRRYFICKATVALGLLFFLWPGRTSYAGLVVKVNPGAWKGESDTEKIFPDFEIRIYVQGRVDDKNRLNEEGEVLFGAEGSTISRVDWTNPKLSRFLLWPPFIEVSSQHPLQSPLQSFRLESLKGLWNDSKAEVSVLIRQGDFADADALLLEVNDVYDP